MQPQRLVDWLIDRGMRARVASCGGVKQLQSWAIRAIATSHHDGVMVFSHDELPEHVQCLNAYVQIVVSNAQRKAIFINWGDPLDGRDPVSVHRWGITILPVSSWENVSVEARQVEGKNEPLFIWGSGIYGWHEKGLLR